jgi:hypothetical protein
MSASSCSQNLHNNTVTHTSGRAVKWYGCALARETRRNARTSCRDILSRGILSRGILSRVRRGKRSSAHHSGPGHVFNMNGIELKHAPFYFGDAVCEPCSLFAWAVLFIAQGKFKFISSRGTLIDRRATPDIRTKEPQKSPQPTYTAISQPSSISSRRGV